MAALHGLHEYFESKIMEEAEDIPDEITKEWVKEIKTDRCLE